MNKSKTNEGGEDRNNNEEVLVVVVSSMKVAQNLSEEEEEEEERTSSYCGRMQHFSFSCNWVEMDTSSCSHVSMFLV